MGEEFSVRAHFWCSGGPFFNFANFGKTEAEMKKLKLNEIKNGRLVSEAITYLKKDKPEKACQLWDLLCLEVVVPGLNLMPVRALLGWQHVLGCSSLRGFQDSEP
eukprot:1136307-Pelagomonas_calceolata.AAC.4